MVVPDTAAEREKGDPFCGECGDFRKDEGEDGDADDATTGMKRRKIGKYKIRFAFFSDSDDLCARRLDKTNPHEMLLMDKSTNCIWCCQLCSNQTLKKKHTREGFKTKYKCSVCDAALCKVPRFDGSSCFQLFHTSSELFNPCTNHRHKI